MLGDDVLENRIHKNDLCYFSRQAFRNFDKKNIYRLSFMHSSSAHDIMPTNFMPNVSALIVSFCNTEQILRLDKLQNLGPVQNAFAWNFFPHLKESNFLFLLKLYINKTNIFLKVSIDQYWHTLKPVIFLYIDFIVTEIYIFT